MIRKCTCGDNRSPAAAFQNQKYGYGQRVMTHKKDGRDVCTVCASVHGSVKKATPQKDAKP